MNLIVAIAITALTGFGLGIIIAGCFIISFVVAFFTNVMKNEFMNDLLRAVIASFSIALTFYLVGGTFISASATYGVEAVDVIGKAGTQIIIWMSLAVGFFGPFILIGWKLDLFK